MNLPRMVFFIEKKEPLEAFACINIILGLATVVLNAVVWSYYRSKCSNTTHMLYFVLSSIDMLSGITSLVHGIMCVAMCVEHTRMILVTMAAAYYLTAVTSRVSTFLSLVVSSVRSLNIVFPVYTVNRILVVTAIAVYSLWWVIFTAGDLYQYHQTLTSPFITSQIFFQISTVVYLCTPTPGSYFSAYIRKWIGLSTTSIPPEYDIWLYAGIPFILPTVLCVLNCGLQIYHLLFKRGKVSTGSKINQKITRTIVLLTIVFIICNTIFIAVFWDGRNEGVEPSPQTYYGLYVTHTMLPTVNSLLNPLILIVSGKRLNQYSRDIASSIIAFCICDRDFKLPSVTQNSGGPSSRNS